VCSALRAGSRELKELESHAKAKLAAAGFRPDYVEIRRAADLGKPDGTEQARELMVLAAAYLGRARLIDNLRVSDRDSIPA
jgi:pantoate--beta-alanine ligase